MKAATVPPAPGVTPSMVPITAPMAWGLNNRLLMAQLGNFKRVEPLPPRAQGGSPICTSISVTANKPTITKMGFTPSNKSSDPKVKRCMPDTGSLPMKAIIKPMHAAIKPRSKEPPDKPAMTDKPKMPKEK